jgi:hypothetical protein
MKVNTGNIVKALTVAVLAGSVSATEIDSSFDPFSYEASFAAGPEAKVLDQIVTSARSRPLRSSQEDLTDLFDRRELTIPTGPTVGVVSFQLSHGQPGSISPFELATDDE